MYLIIIKYIQIIKCIQAYNIYFNIRFRAISWINNIHGRVKVCSYVKHINK